MTPGDPHLLFVFGSRLGWLSAFESWRQTVERVAPRLDVTWLALPGAETRGWIARSPRAIRPSVDRYLTTAEIFVRGKSRPYTAAFFAPHTLGMSLAWDLRRIPTFHWLDATWRDFEVLRPHYGQRERSGWWQERRLERERRSLLRARGLFAMSTWTSRSLVEDYGIPRQNVHILPPGVDTSVWRPATQRLSDGVVRLIFVGGDFQRKGGDLLLRWARETPAQGWELHIVTRAAPVPTRNVVWHQFGPNEPGLVDLVRSCDIFVQPTRADCVPIALIEAMAAGLPSIVSNVGGIPDLVEDGVTGHLVVPGDFDSLRVRIESLLRDGDRRIAMGSAARRRAAAHFDGRDVVSKGLSLILRDSAVTRA